MEVDEKHDHVKIRIKWDYDYNLRVLHNISFFLNIICGIMLFSFACRLLLLIHLTIKSISVQNIQRSTKQGRCSTEPYYEQNQEVGSQKDPVVLALEKLSEQLCKQQQTESELYTKIINQQKKSELDLKTEMDSKFEYLAMNFRRTQKEQFAELKNQQKLFSQQLKGITSKFDKNNHCNQEVEKLFESVREQCNEINTAVNNHTKQQNILQNLVLDLNSKNIESKEDKKNNTTANNSVILQECKICMDKPLTNVALRPCGHIVFCEDCIKNLPRNCPICRKMIIDTLKIFHT